MKKIFNLLTAFLLVGTVFLIKPNSAQGQVNCKAMPDAATATCGQGEYTDYPIKCSPTGASNAFYCCKSDAYCDKTRTDMNTIPPSSFENFDKTVQQDGTNLQSYLGGDNAFVESTVNSFTGLVIGRNLNWQELRAGNFDKVQIGGALGFTSNLVSLILTQPPVSSKEYFADLGKNLGIAKPVYAQGIGFKGLSNLLPLWKATRNLAYVFFVVIFLATGLAIMFRIKLDPKTVITIQSAIPKLIIAMILVTFSYAIAGLMIDLIYLLIYLGVLALKGVPGIGEIAQKQRDFTNLGFLNVLGLLFGGEMRGIWTLGEFVGTGTVGVILHIIMILLASAVSALFVLIFAVITLSLVIKLFFSLLSCYIGIIISVIVAPLQIMLGVLPGSTAGFGSWFRNLLANILVFPAVSLFLLLGWLLTNYTGPTWTPPVLGASGGALTALIGMGMLLLVTKVPEMVKAAFKMKPAGYGTAIGEAFGPARGATKSAVQGLVSSAETRYRNEAAAGKGISIATANAKTIADILKLLGRFK